MELPKQPCVLRKCFFLILHDPVLVVRSLHQATLKEIVFYFRPHVIPGLLGHFIFHMDPA